MMLRQRTTGCLRPATRFLAARTLSTQTLTPCSPRLMDVLRYVHHTRMVGVLPTQSALRFQSTTSSDGEGGGSSSNQAQETEKVIEQLKMTVGELQVKMMEQFGSSVNPEEAWMMHFYQHRNMDYCLPAIRLMADKDNIRTNAPILSRIVFFLARSFETASATSLSSTALQLPLVSRLDALDILSMLHQIETREAKNVFQRLAQHVHDSQNEDARRVVENIKEAPVQPLQEWPALHLAFNAQEMARAKNINVSEVPSLGFNRADCVQDPNSLLTDNSATVFDYCNLTQQHRFHHRSEYEQQKHKDIDTLREESKSKVPSEGNYPVTEPVEEGMLPATHDFALTMSACQLECLWASFYATGDDEYIIRILQMALPWANWADHEGSIAFITDLSQPFPDSIKLSIELGHDPLLSNLNATISRLCAWSLVQNSKAHEAVFRIMAEECSKLGDLCVDPLYQTREFDDYHLNHKKVVLYPALLHLMSRASGESDFA